MKYNYDYFELNDEQFLRIIEFHNKLVRDFLEKQIYEFIAFYIAKGIESSSIFDNNFKRIVNTSLEYFDSHQFRNSINYKKIKNLLVNKYNIKIIKKYPIKYYIKK